MRPNPSLLASLLIASVGLCASPASAAGLPAGSEGGAGPLPRGDVWINSAPLAREDWRGRVTLVEFWTFGCINCVRTIPAMLELDRLYPDSSLRIVAVHTPEFERERDPAAVRRAVAQHGIRFPVVLDNEWTNWRAYGNRYWPAIYLLDREGRVRHVHIGELHVGSAKWNELRRRIVELGASAGQQE